MNDSPSAGMAGEIPIDHRMESEWATATEMAPPQVALLSNGQYGLVMTAAGGGCSTWRGLNVTRWRPDATRDCWGQFCFIRDRTKGRAWSAGYQPLCRAADENEAMFHADRAEFRRRDEAIETRLAVCVAPDCDAEVHDPRSQCSVSFITGAAETRAAASALAEQFQDFEACDQAFSRALTAVEDRLVRPEGKLIQLFDPPFDRGAL
jgi:cellobiose phosphorylase